MVSELPNLGPATREITERQIALGERIALDHEQNTTDSLTVNVGILVEAVRDISEILRILAGHIDAIRLHVGLDPSDDLQVKDS